MLLVRIALITVHQGGATDGCNSIRPGVIFFAVIVLHMRFILFRLISLVITRCRLVIITSLKLHHALHVTPNITAVDLFHHLKRVMTEYTIFLIHYLSRYFLAVHLSIWLVPITAFAPKP